MKVQRCKGFKDLTIENMKRFRLIEGAFRDTCLKWGFNEVRTPTLEYLHLFTATGTFTPGLLNKVYSFLDWDGWSGQRVVLRPDGTIPIARLYIDSMSDQELAKLFYVTNIFIFEETGSTTREKWQCGVELIGADSSLADVELIAMAVEILKRLKLNNLNLKLSHAGLIKALLSELGLCHEDQTNTFDRILDGDLTVLSNISPEKSAVGRTITALLELKGKSGTLLKNFKSLYTRELPGLRKHLDDFINIVNLMENLNIDFDIDIDTGRGFEYYTGVVFHLYADGINIGGGGRYNALIPILSGSQKPASGFALYLDRLMELIDTGALSPVGKYGVLVKTDSTEPVIVKKGFELIHAIHAAGGMAEMDMDSHAPADFVWTVNVKQDHSFVLINRTDHKEIKTQNIDELIKLIEYERTDKSSSAQRKTSR